MPICSPAGKCSVKIYGLTYLFTSSTSPTLVANLWDVTDRDIDKFCQTVFDKIQLNPENVRAWNGSTNKPNMSLVSAVAQARSACKLKYLTGAAPVVYGIPFYL